MARYRVELFQAIRRDHRWGVSLRGLSERYGVHRRTVRQAIDSAEPPSAVGRRCANCWNLAGHAGPQAMQRLLRTARATTSDPAGGAST